MLWPGEDTTGRAASAALLKTDKQRMPAYLTMLGSHSAICGNNSSNARTMT
jgi:hypothetical protein